MNPELQRNLWLETGRRRLVWAGVILALVFAAVWLLDRGRNAHEFVIAGAAVFAAAALGWAPREARASVTREVQARTWDFQRLSSLSPWAMTWGKLVGATSRTWVFSGVALLIAFLQLASISTTAHALYWSFTAVGLAVLMQAAGMAMGLIEIRKARAAGRPPGLRSPGLLILSLALLAASAAAWVYRHPWWRAEAQRPTAGAGPTVAWWSHAYDASAFAALSLAVFAAGGLAWAWRLMRLELQLTTAPLAWPPFVLFAGLYAAGFAQLAPQLWSGIADAGMSTSWLSMKLRLACAGLVFAGCAYVGAFIDPADRVQARATMNWLRQGPAGGTPSLPLFVAPLALCAATSLWAATLYVREGEGGVAVYVAAMLTFIVRDLGLITAVRFGSWRRADLAAVVWLLLAYLAGWGVGAAAGGMTGAALTHPSRHHPSVSLIGGSVQAALVWSLAAWRIAHPARRPVGPSRPTAPP